MALQRIATFCLAVTAVFSAAFVQAQGLPSASPESVGMSAPKLAHIKEAFAQEIDKGNLPGVVVMVARKGKLVYSETVGFQNKEAGKPLSKDAIFRIYSMTKPLVSVAAMMLIEDGKMQLNDAVSKFIPAMKGLQVSVAKADGGIRQGHLHAGSFRSRNDGAGPAAPHVRPRLRQPHPELAGQGCLRERRHG